MSPFRFDRNIGKSERKDAKALLSFKQIQKICTKIQKNEKTVTAVPQNRKSLKEVMESRNKTENRRLKNERPTE